MQKLHLVGFTTEHDGLIFSARKGTKAGGYLIPLDRELLSTIAEAERLRNGDAGEQGEGEGVRQRRPDSRLTPREIQAHLRAGRSIPEVAAEAGVGAEWVERFAVPIVAEQAQMVERARAMTFSKTRLGQSTQPLGTSVRWNLADKGVAIGEEAFDEGWSAFQLQDEIWMVRFRYTSRARLQVAEWELDLGRNQLTSRNRLATELGYVEKGRRPPALPAPAPRPPAAPPVRVVEEFVELAEPQSPATAPARRTRRPAARRSTRRPSARKKSTRQSKSTARKKATAKKATARKQTAKRSVPKKPAKRPTVKKARAKKATPKKVARKPARKATTRPRPPQRATAAKRPAAKKATPPTPAAATRPVQFDVEPDFEPDFEPDVPEVAEAPPARPRRTPQSQRPRIAAASAREAASKRSGQRPVRKQPAARAARQVSSERPVRRRAQPARAGRQASKTANGGEAVTPNLSGPLARSLLARRLMARKSAQGDGGRQTKRPLRVR